MKEYYKVLDNFIPINECSDMARRMEKLLVEGKYRSPDSQCRLSPAFYGIFNDEAEKYRPKVEEATGLELTTVYTYGRIYQEGDKLVVHTDRKGAEISISITLDYDKYIWPFYMQNESGDFDELTLDIGQGVIYQGCVAGHMRHPMLDQEFQHQTFFHYVDKNGPYANANQDGHQKLLNNEEAERWNFPEWNDELYKLDPNGFIEKFIRK